MKISRRKLLLITSSVSIASIVGYRTIKSKIQKVKIPGKITGASFDRGHLLKEPKFPKPEMRIEKNALIIGGGISGLTAAYYLEKSGEKDFLLLELESEVGGNSRAIKNNSLISPMGAHYLPLLNKESHELKEFLFEHSVISKNSDIPKYNDFYLCSDPQERLYINGRWQKGIEPDLGLKEADRSEIKRFLDLMETYKNYIGKDNKPAFAIPIYKSSRDKEILDLDKISFASFLAKEKFNNKYLNWYIKYCCLDDYGVSSENISAWAGIHYFASRRGKGAELEEEGEHVLTWPEGNNFLVKLLEKKISKNISLDSMVYKITKENDYYIVDYYSFNQKKSFQVKTKAIFYGAPKFTLSKVYSKISNEFDYAPWMTAHIYLNKKLDDSKVPLSWDNVNFYGKSIGYIVNNHQNLNSKVNSHYLTLYWPLNHLSPKRARIQALGRSHQDWVNLVIEELKILHPEIESMVSSMDIALMGHGMKITGLDKLNLEKLNKPEQNFYMIHSDQSMVSIFEEAFYLGMNAAKDFLNES